MRCRIETFCLNDPLTKESGRIGKSEQACIQVNHPSFGTVGEGCFLAERSENSAYSPDMADIQGQTEDSMAIAQICAPHTCSWVPESTSGAEILLADRFSPQRTPIFTALDILYKMERDYVHFSYCSLFCCFTAFSYILRQQKEGPRSVSYSVLLIILFQLLSDVFCKRSWL